MGLRDLLSGKRDKNAEIKAIWQSRLESLFGKGELFIGPIKNYGDGSTRYNLSFVPEKTAITPSCIEVDAFYNKNKKGKAVESHNSISVRAPVLGRMVVGTFYRNHRDLGAYKSLIEDLTKRCGPSPEQSHLPREHESDEHMARLGWEPLGEESRKIFGEGWAQTLYPSKDEKTILSRFTGMSFSIREPHGTVLLESCMKDNTIRVGSFSPDTGRFRPSSEIGFVLETVNRLLNYQ